MKLPGQQLLFYKELAWFAVCSFFFLINEYSFENYFLFIWYENSFGLKQGSVCVEGKKKQNKCARIFQITKIFEHLVFSWQTLNSMLWKTRKPEKMQNKLWSLRPAKGETMTEMSGEIVFYFQITRWRDSSSIQPENKQKHDNFDDEKSQQKNKSSPGCW